MVARPSLADGRPVACLMRWMRRSAKRSWRVIASRRGQMKVQRFAVMRLSHDLPPPSLRHGSSRVAPGPFGRKRVPGSKTSDTATPSSVVPRQPSSCRPGSHEPQLACHGQCRVLRFPRAACVAQLRLAEGPIRSRFEARLRDHEGSEVSVLVPWGSDSQMSVLHGGGRPGTWEMAARARRLVVLWRRTGQDGAEYLVRSA